MEWHGNVSALPSTVYLRAELAKQVLEKNVEDNRALWCVAVQSVALCCSVLWFAMRRHRLGGSLNCQVSLAIWPYFCRAPLQKINLLITATHTALAHPIFTVTRMYIFSKTKGFAPRVRGNSSSGGRRRQLFCLGFLLRLGAQISRLCGSCAGVLPRVAVCCSVKALQIVCW